MYWYLLISRISLALFQLYDRKTMVKNASLEKRPARARGLELRAHLRASSLHIPSIGAASDLHQSWRLTRQLSCAGRAMAYAGPITLLSQALSSPDAWGLSSLVSVRERDVVIQPPSFLVCCLENFEHGHDRAYFLKALCDLLKSSR